MERPNDYESITTLNISFKNLEELPSWVSECKNLEILNCGYNKLTQIDNLPPTLKILNCSNNYITQVDNLPQTLEKLYCFGNPLKYDFEHTLENIRNYNNENKLLK